MSYLLIFTNIHSIWHRMKSQEPEEHCPRKQDLFFQHTLLLSSPGKGRTVGWPVWSPTHPPTFTWSTAASKFPRAATVPMSFMTSFGCRKPLRSPGVLGRLLQGEWGALLTTPYTGTLPQWSLLAASGTGASREGSVSGWTATVWWCWEEVQQTLNTEITPDTKKNTNKDHTQQRESGIS